MRGLSTLTEVMTRGEIFMISPSIIRNNVYICIFKDGTQANIDGDIYAKLTAE